MVLLCSILLSHLIAYSYTSCGVRVFANSSSAIFSLFMYAVNISRTHSFSQSSQSARDASSTKSAWKCIVQMQ